jgi:uncharacterized membrane-anchored protein
MRRKAILIVAFALLAALQAGIPLSMLASRADIISNGTEIRLAVAPRDPRSITRGDYSRLTYEIGRLTNVTMDGEFPECGHPDRASCAIARVPVYVVLAPGENGLHRVLQVDRKPPPKGTLFIKGKVLSGTYSANASEKCPQGRCFSGGIIYGIEDWFGPQRVPAAVDRAARGSLTAIARVSESGEAVLADLLLDGTPVVPPAH